MQQGDFRYVSLFRNGRNQAIRIPKEFELASSEAIIRRQGEYLVIEPVAPRSLLNFLKNQSPQDEAFPDLDDALPNDESVF